MKSTPNPGIERVRYELRATGVPAEPSNPLRSGIHTRGYLPHVKREGAWYFITFRLADSLPQQVLLEFKRKHAERLARLSTIGGLQEKEEIDRELQRQIERYLDRGVGECHLRRADIAKIVAEALLHFHDRQYILDEWVIMPNHVHLVLWPMPNYTLSANLRDRKRYTSRQANLILGRTGQTFWQHESYDHWIRDDAEKLRIRRYIRNNPVLAKLCRAAEEWRWSSAFARRLPACATADSQSGATRGNAPVGALSETPPSLARVGPIAVAPTVSRLYRRLPTGEAVLSDRAKTADCFTRI